MIGKGFLSTALFCGLFSGLWGVIDTAPLLNMEQEAESFSLSEIPEKFYLKQRWFSWTTTFDVETDRLKLGTINRKLLSWTVEYNFYDFNELLLANARMRFFSFGAIFDIKDAQEQPIGTVNEKLFRFFPTFEMIDKEGEILAIAKMNFWGTKYTLRDPVTEGILAVLSRPFFRLKNDWTVELVDPELVKQKKIDPAFFIVVMAYQTDREYWRRRRNYYQHRCCITSPSFSENLNQLKVDLDSYRPQFQGELPSEEEFERIEAYSEKYLLAYEQNLSEEEKEEENDLPEIYHEKIGEGIAHLIPLLNDASLAEEEKRALFLMLDARVEELN